MAHKKAFQVESLESAMEVKRFLEDDLFVKGIKTNEGAKRLNISAERLYKYLNPHSFNNNFPAFLLPLYTIRIGPEFLRYLAADGGFAISKIPEGDQGLREPLGAAAEVMRHCGGILLKFLAGIGDEQISLLQMKEIKTDVIEAIGAMMNLANLMEEMRGKK